MSQFTVDTCYFCNQTLIEICIKAKKRGRPNSYRSVCNNHSCSAYHPILLLSEKLPPNIKTKGVGTIGSLQVLVDIE